MSSVQAGGVLPGQHPGGQRGSTGQGVLGARPALHQAGLGGGRVGQQPRVIEFGGRDALRVIDDQHPGAAQGIQERAVSRLRPPGQGQGQGGVAERLQQRGPQLRQRRLHRHQRRPGHQAARQQAQRLVERDGPALPRVPVEARHGTRRSRVHEGLGHLARLPGGDTGRTRHLQPRIRRAGQRGTGAGLGDGLYRYGDAAVPVVCPAGRARPASSTVPGNAGSASTRP
ncbi:hypothetical protein G5C65_37465 [Streptomyces sp. SB3404]|uniref:Uncharacterized protein n=1 Tax=Streptomyces boncukensis TaxID=2711219 RepID=A0A6G4XAM6_9ACTN|nr:hypothetical protein [Streptomyces boncukensis]